MGTGESDPSPPRISETDSGAVMDYETGERMRQESGLIALTEVPKIGRPVGNPMLVHGSSDDFGGFWPNKEELERITPKGATAYRLGRMKHIGGRDLIAPIQFYNTLARDNMLKRTSSAC